MNMNEWNIGVDIVDVARFRQLDFLSSKHFYERVFTSREIEYCLSFKDSAPHFAANFAAKEAVYKAMNRFYDCKLDEIEVLRNKTGAPYINLYINHKEVAKDRGSKINLPFEIKVSLSHSGLHAIAFAVVSYSRGAIRNFKLHIEKGVLK